MAAESSPLPPCVLDLLRSQKYSLVCTLSNTPSTVVMVVRLARSRRNALLKISPDPLLFRNEVLCLEDCGEHPNILQLRDKFSSKRLVCEIFERIEGETVISLVMGEGRLTEKECCLITRQVVSALSFLHSKRWFHGNIKPDNLIYDRVSGTVKLMDFQFCSKTALWSKHTDIKGTLSYSSPELRKGKYSGPECDVWSLGVSLYVMITGSFPFGDEELKKTTEMFVVPQKGVSFACGHLLERMLDKKSKKRPTIDEVKDHIWFNEQ